MDSFHSTEEGMLMEPAHRLSTRVLFLYVVVDFAVDICCDFVHSCLDLAIPCLTRHADVIYVCLEAR